MDHDYQKKIVREVLKEELENAFKEWSLVLKESVSGQPLPERKQLTREEVIKQYNISKRTLINWEHRGLKTLTIGRKKYYLIEEVERFIKSHDQ